MSLSAEQKSVIISVRCGSRQGTAFWVGNDAKFLTARHVVIGELRHKEKVSLFYKEKNFVVTEVVELNGQKDVAILKCNELETYLLKEKLKPLLPVPVAKERLVGEDFSICGYPNEIGNGVDKVEIEVRGHVLVNDRSYDIVTSKLSSLLLIHYDGFSGAPVMNACGAVVGIAVVELSNKLAFLSVDAIKYGLGRAHVSYGTNISQYDTSPGGRHASIQRFEEAKKLAGKRYMEHLHVTNNVYESFVSNFAHRPQMIKKRKVLESIEAEVLNMHISQTEYAYSKGDFKNLSEAVSKWRRDPLNGHLREKLEHYEYKVKSEYKTYSLMTSPFAYIMGRAGTGKTHLSCEITKKLLEKQNVYLFFGSQFSSSEKAFTQLLSLMELSETQFRRMNEACKQDNNNVLIIIDAINEGAGDGYWSNELKHLVGTIKNYSNVKLLATVRCPYESIMMASGLDEVYQHYELKGYSPKSVVKAADRYFKEYGVEEEYINIYKREFENPLLLLIFCIAYRSMTEEERQKITFVRLFELYIRDCNKVISQKVDEDEYRDITYQFMAQLAASAVDKHHGGVIPREEARELADNICPGRFWHNNLLKATIDEDLLLDTKAEEREGMLMFGFEQMADFMKANYLLKMNEKEMFVVLQKAWQYYQEHVTANESKFNNMIVALLSIWDKPVSIFDLSDAKSEWLLRNVRKAKDFKREANNKRICAWLRSKKENVSPQNALRLGLTAKNGEEVFSKWHQILMNMSMSERDARWTVSVNSAFRGQRMLPYVMDCVDKTDSPRIMTKVLAWMLTTSFPQVHHFLSKMLLKIFNDHSETIKDVLLSFEEADDMYIHHGILEAVYGFVLRCRESVILTWIDSLVYSCYYDKKPYAAEDLLVRYWAMKILECINSRISGGNWSRVQEYKRPTKITYSSKLSAEKLAELCKEPGEKRMYYTLTRDSDFHRYVLDSNFYFESRVFVNRTHEGYKSISIDYIVGLVTHILKSNFKLQHESAVFDKELYSYSRHNNEEERIGKKYVWLALYKAYAYLCDMYVIKDRDGKCYPWYTGVLPNVDPTLVPDSEAKMVYTYLHLVPKNTNSESINVLLDADGGEWIRIVSFDTKNNMTIYSNGCFVKTSQMERCDEWAKYVDFTGRWMPEPMQEGFKNIWNEYPWSDSYQSNKEPNVDDTDGRCPVSVVVAYEKQLQEESRGLWGNFDKAELYLPCEDMMEVQRLYTAERGVIRKSDNNDIVAINANYIDKNISGLFIRKDELLKYMRKKKYCLYSFELAVFTGPDVHKNGYRHDLSGCSRFCEKGRWKLIQKLHNPKE